MKKTDFFHTQGISELNKSDINTLFLKANELHTDDNYFISFKPDGNKTKVTDGNDTLFTTLDIEIPDTLFCIRNDYGNRYVTTLMFAHEY